MSNLLKHKHFIKIKRIVFDNELALRNIDGFEKGDIVQITEKFDGTNSSIRYNIETGMLEAFSSGGRVTEGKDLRGFWQFVQNINADKFKEYSHLVFFGEWSGGRNLLVYDDTALNRWYVFDIYDTDKQEYLQQEEVKKLVSMLNLDYVHEFYYGPFISWEHVMSFCHSPNFGKQQEGVIIKNQTKLNNTDETKPFMLKIVNDEFKEIGKQNKQDILNSKEVLEEKNRVQELVDLIVTERRFQKHIEKLKSQGYIGDNLSNEDISKLAKLLPQLIYKDCIEEEPEIVDKAGKLFGKLCSQKVKLLINQFVGN